MTTLQQAVQEFGAFSSHVSSICDETISCFREIQQTLKDEGSILSTAALGDVQDILKKKPAVIFIGDRNCGKSSLLNEVLGGSYLPVHETPCTSRIVRVVFAEESHADLIARDGTVISDPLKRCSVKKILKEYAVLSDEDKQHDEKLNCTVRAGLNHDLLRSGVELIDSPGRNETDELDGILDEFLTEGTVPLIVYIIDGGPGLRLTDVKTINLLQEKFPRVSFMFVCNKVDTMARACELDHESEDEDDYQVDKGALVFDKLKNAKLIPPEALIDTYPSFHAVSAKATREARRNETKHGADENHESLKAVASFRRFQECLKEKLELAVKQETKRAVEKLLVLQESFVCGVAHARKMNSSRPEEIPDIFVDIVDAEAAFKNTLATLAANQNEIQSLIEGSLCNLERHFMQIAEQYEITAVDNIREDMSESMLQVGSPDVALEMLLTLDLDSVNLSFARFVEDMKETILSEIFNALKDPIVQRMTDPLANASEKIMRLAEKLQHPIAVRIFAEIYEVDFKESRDQSSQMLLIVLDRLLDSISAIVTAAFRKEISGPLSNVFSYGLGTTPFMQDIEDKNNRSEVVKILLSSIDPCQVSKAVIEECRAKFDQMHCAFERALTSLQQFIEGLTRETNSLQLDVLRDVYTPKVRVLAIRSYALQFLMEKGPLMLGDVVACASSAQIYECVSPRWNHDGKPSVVKVVEKEKVGSEVWNRTAIDLINAWEIFGRHGSAHPNLLSVFGWLMPRESVLQIVMEKAKTDLLTALHRRIPLRKRLTIAADVAQGLKAMHDLGYVYRDLKPETVLVTDDGAAKINMAVPVRPFEETRLGCPFHISNEMYRNYGTDSTESSYDIYAFGMLLWVLCEGSGEARPLAYSRCLTNTAMRMAVQDSVVPERPPEATDACWHLMVTCWKDRIGISIDGVLDLVNKL